MKIAVLDGEALNQDGRISWTKLAELGELMILDRTGDSDVAELCKDANVVLTDATRLDADVLARLAKLKCIGVLGTGYNAVDVREAGRRGIPVINVVNYGTEAVAQHAMALLLELCRRPALHDASVREGQWASCPDFCYWLAPQVELTDLTMGIVGFGTIGRRVGALASAFGMRVLAASARLSGADMEKRAQERGENSCFPVCYVDLPDLFAQSDVVSLHCPLSDSTRKLVDAATLARMKKGAFLINVSRGPLLDEEAVAAALASGHLAGLGADVASREPIQADNPLLKAPNVILTPHLAWGSRNARQKLVDMLAGHLRAWREGHPRSVVNEAWLASRNDASV